MLNILSQSFVSLMCCDSEGALPVSVSMVMFVRATTDFRSVQSFTVKGSIEFTRIILYRSRKHHVLLRAERKSLQGLR